MNNRRLSEFERMLMLSVLRIGEDAYGATIQKDLLATTDRSVSVASIYVALVRLESSGLVRSEMSAPTPVRGGRGKRCYTVMPSGVAALREARKYTDSMWGGVDLGCEGEAGST